MKASVPVLTPLLRTNTQGRILAELYLHSDKEFTVTEIARRVNTALPNASRELNRLVEADFLVARMSGRNRYVRVNEQHPLYKPVAEIVMYAYGPAAVLSEVLRDIPGVDEAYIYGSWAARLSGEAGPDPQDIDVLVVGDSVDHLALDRAAERARKQLNREVNPRVMSHAAWESKSDLFLKHLDSRPLLTLSLSEEAA